MKSRIAIGTLVCLVFLSMTMPVLSGGTLNPARIATLHRDLGTYEVSEDRLTSSPAQAEIQVGTSIGCPGKYEIWAVDEDDPTKPVVIAQGKKVLFGLGLFENIEGNYALPDGLGKDYGYLVDFTLDVILHLSESSRPRVALYDPDPLLDGDAGWNEINDRHDEWPVLDDWSINPFETESYEMVLDEWKDVGAISTGAQIESLDELYAPGGSLAFDVLILDQSGQANTPDYDSEIETIQAYLDNGGSIIISAYAFIDFASFFEWWEEFNVQYWYESEMNDQFLDAMFPGVTVHRERERVLVGGSWQWRIRDYAGNAVLTQSAPSGVQTLYSRGDGLHGFLRLEVPMGFTVEVDIDPNTLNKDSEGRWVTVYIETPQGCDPRGIDPSTILLNGILTPVLDSHYGWVRSEDSYIVDHDFDRLGERMVKFDRKQVEDILSVGSMIWINITGSTYSGVPFFGSDVLKVIDRELSVIFSLDYLPERSELSSFDRMLPFDLWKSRGGA
ncbi:MAG: hypothetical protein ACE5KV_05050 [Thermoplasmata archaeon]